MIKIGFDIMGSDMGPNEAMKSAISFAKKNSDVEVNVYGNKEKVSIKQNMSNIVFHHCKDEISMTDGIMSAMRKKDSSMMNAINDVKKGITKGVLSAGNTGVYLYLANAVLKPIKNVERPAFMPMIPNTNGANHPTVLLDAGASLESNPVFLEQYAKMGAIFIESNYNVKDPKVALLNIGGEEKKGSKDHVEVHKNLKASKLKFIGNVEGRDILTTEANVIVADGYSGNIALKTLEGTAAVLFSEVKKALKSSWFSKINALIVKGKIKKRLSIYDYRNTGGALFVGVNGILVKAHGSSDATAFENGLKLVAKSSNTNIVKKIEEAFK